MNLHGIGNAPVSFGIWEEQRALAAEPGEADRFLSLLSGTGYTGTETGPPGYLGNAETIGERLDAHGLRLIGGYLPLRLGESQALGDDLAALGPALDMLAAPGTPGTLAILADAGGSALEASPARHWTDRSLALSDAGWRRLADGVARAAEAARSRGLVPSFHPHIATQVESPWEVERLLALTDVELTLDTGHLVLAGASATECLAAWGDRINHLHVKDVRLDVMRDARGEGRTDLGACPLGAGDADIAGFLTALADSDYEGWIVVEQDRAPAPADAFGSMAVEQAANLEYIRTQLGLV